MDRIKFKGKMKRDGFIVSEKSMAAGTVNQDHTHPFDARLFVLDGHITIGQGGEEKIFGPGDICSVDANVEHSEKVDSVSLPILLLCGEFEYMRCVRFPPNQLMAIAEAGLIGKHTKVMFPKPFSHLYCGYLSVGSCTLPN